MNDPVFVYRIADLPELLSGPVSEGDPILACQFYAARGGSKAIAAAFAQVPEPPCADVPRWLEVASLAGQGLARQRSLVDLAPVDGSGGRLSFGFHSGDAAAFVAALREAGAEVIEAAPILGSIAWLEIEGMEPVYERWARGGTVAYWALTPVRPASAAQPALYAFPVEIQPDLRAHALFSASGASLDASFLEKGGGHRRAFPVIVPAAPPAPPNDARYEALLAGTADALVDGGQPDLDPAMFAPLLLLEDASLVSREDFRAAYFEVARYAGLLAQRESASWRALGVEGPIGIAHGLASPTFIDHAGHLAWTLEDLLDGLERTLEALPEADALSTRKAILVRWTRRLLEREIHASVGSIGSRIHAKVYLDLHYLHGLPLEAIDALVRAEVVRAAGE